MGNKASVSNLFAQACVESYGFLLSGRFAAMFNRHANIVPVAVDFFQRLTM